MIMDNDFKRYLNSMTRVFLDNNFTRAKKGYWFLDGRTLVDFICNDRIEGAVKIGIYGTTKEYLKDKARRFGYDLKEVSKNKFVIKSGKFVTKIKLYDENSIDKNIIAASPRDVEIIRRKRDNTMSKSGLWEHLVDSLCSNTVAIPYKVGAFLDNTRPGWFEKIKYVERKAGKSDFFTPKRIENAVELMEGLHRIADKTGFRKHLFPGFGTLLGIIRENGFIKSDHDMDHCIMGPLVTQRQIELFLIEANKETTINKRKYIRGLFQGRKKGPIRRNDNNRFLWASCGHKKVSTQNGCKSCIWDFFEHDGYLWHTKGKLWINNKKFDQTEYNYDINNIQAVAKGVPAKFFKEFTTIKFKGIDINVPKLVGHCLDEWYPGWQRPKGGCSAKNHVLIIPKWKDKKGWYRA